MLGFAAEVLHGGRRTELRVLLLSLLIDSIGSNSCPSVQLHRALSKQAG